MPGAAWPYVRLPAPLVCLWALGKLGLVYGILPSGRLHCLGLYGGRHAYGRCTAAGAICTEAAMPTGARGSGPCQRRPSDRGGVAICTAAGAIGTEAAMPYRSRGLGLPREGQVTKRRGHMYGCRSHWYGALLSRRLHCSCRGFGVTHSRDSSPAIQRPLRSRAALSAGTFGWSSKTQPQVRKRLPVRLLRPAPEPGGPAFFVRSSCWVSRELLQRLVPSRLQRRTHQKRRRPEPSYFRDFCIEWHSASSFLEKHWSQ